MAARERDLRSGKLTLASIDGLHMLKSTLIGPLHSTYSRTLTFENFC